MIYEITKPASVAPLFSGWQETIVRSCLEGVMGHLYSTSAENPKSAAAALGDFCFLAGTPDRELLSDQPDRCAKDTVILVPQTPEWGCLIEEHYQEKAVKIQRYAIKKEPRIFDPAALRRLATSLPPEYSLRRIDEPLFHYCQENDWCADFVFNYKNYAQYRKLGLGVMAFYKGEAVAGASSYSSYHGGIEIQIDTRETYRRRGLAAACGAKLILACTERGLYPSWDAANPASVALAEKLGYHFDRAYTAYEISRSSISFTKEQTAHRVHQSRT